MTVWWIIRAANDRVPQRENQVPSLGLSSIYSGLEFWILNFFIGAVSPPVVGRECVLAGFGFCHEPVGFPIKYQRRNENAEFNY